MPAPDEFDCLLHDIGGTPGVHTYVWMECEGVAGSGSIFALSKLLVDATVLCPDGFEPGYRGPMELEGIVPPILTLCRRQTPTGTTHYLELPGYLPATASWPAPHHFQRA